MFGRSEAAPEGWSPESWRDNELYLYGVDLFNLGYWWEAHAAWEALWQTRREEPVGAFLQGLIQVAAALVQYRAGRREGARKVASKGLSHLRRLSSGLGTSAEGVPTTYMGVDIGRFADAVERFLGLGKPGGGRPTEAAPPVLDLA